MKRPIVGLIPPLFGMNANRNGFERKIRETPDADKQFRVFADNWGISKKIRNGVPGMKRRRPGVVYLLQTFTLLYLFIWIGLIMKEINELMGQKVFHPVKKSIYLFLSFMIYLTSLIIYHQYGETNPVPGSWAILSAGLAATVLWITLLVRYIRQICTHIARLENQYGLENPITKGLTTLFIFIYCIAIIRIQIHMNRIIEYKESQTKRTFQGADWRGQSLHGRR
jgi:hypothetical protein